MNIIVFGSNSGLGQSLVPILKKEYNVTTVGRKNCDINLDLNCLPENSKYLRNYQIIINCAACFDKSKNSDLIFKINVEAPLKIYRGCIEEGVKKFINISSMSAGFGNGHILSNNYSKSKKICEEELIKFHNKGTTDLIILRPSQLFGGKKNQLLHRNFLSAAYQFALKNKPIPIYGNRDALRNYLSFENFSFIILNVIKSNVNGLFTCTSRENYKFTEIAKKVCKSLDKKANYKFIDLYPDLVDVIQDYQQEFYNSISFHPNNDIDEIFDAISCLYRFNDKIKN